MIRALALLTLLALTPLAHAKGACEVDLGQGWPPATRNHGSAVEGLFTAGAKDKHLPKHWSALIKSLNQLDAQLAAAG